MNAQEFINLNGICRYCDTPRETNEPCNCDGWQIEELRAENARLFTEKNTLFIACKNLLSITDDKSKQLAVGFSNTDWLNAYAMIKNAVLTIEEDGV